MSMCRMLFLKGVLDLKTVASPVLSAVSTVRARGSWTEGPVSCLYLTKTKQFLVFVFICELIEISHSIVKQPLGPLSLNSAQIHYKICICERNWKQHFVSMAWYFKDISAMSFLLAEELRGPTLFSATLTATSAVSLPIRIGYSHTGGSTNSSPSINSIWPHVGGSTNGSPSIKSIWPQAA